MTRSGGRGPRTGRFAVLALFALWVIAAGDRAQAQTPPEVGWLGISIAEVGEELADRLATTFGPEAGTGVLVVDVLKDGPAERADVHRGDVIVKLDAQPIWDVRQLQRVVRSRSVDRRVKVTVLRDASRLTLPVTIGAMPASARAQLAAEPFGFLVREQDSSDTRGLQPAANRVLVAFVDPGSPAARAGLRPQDLILQVNNQPVEGLDDFGRAMRRIDRTVSLRVERRGTPDPLVLTLDLPPR